MTDQELKAHAITMEYLRQNPPTGIGGASVPPETFAQKYLQYYERILAKIQN